MCRGTLKRQPRPELSYYSAVRGFREAMDEFYTFAVDNSQRGRPATRTSAATTGSTTIPPPWSAIRKNHSLSSNRRSVSSCPPTRETIGSRKNSAVEPGQNQQPDAKSSGAEA